MRGAYKYLAYSVLVLAMIALTILSGCVPSKENGSQGGGGLWTMIIFLVLIFGVLYFLMIRPQRKKQSEHSRLVQELRKGDKVITAGGIHGEIDYIGEEEVVLKVEDGHRLRLLKNSIMSKRETEEGES